MTDENRAAENEAENQDQDAGKEQDRNEGAASGDSGPENLEPTEIEALAMEDGWAPKDQWRGDPDEWVDAKTFIRNGRSILKTTLSKLDRELAEQKQTIGEFAEHYKTVHERAYEQARADLKAQQRAAVEDGDTAAYEAAEAKLEDLEKSKPAPKGNGEDKPSNVAQEALTSFRQANPWYGEDVKMTAFANSIAEVVALKHGGPSREDQDNFYSALADHVKKEFPEKFGKAPAPKGPARVEGGAVAKRNTGEKTYDDLPPEAKAACDKFVKQGLLDQKQYVKDYFSQEQS